MDNQANVGKDSMYSGKLGGNIGRGAANFTPTPSAPDPAPEVRRAIPVESVPPLLKRSSDEPSIPAQEKMDMATELFNNEFSNKKDIPIPSKDSSNNVVPLSNTEIDSTRELAAKAVESSKPDGKTDWFSLVSKRSSAPEYANRFIANGLETLSNIDIFKGIDSPEVKAENIRRGVYDEILFNGNTPQFAKRTSTLDKKTSKKPSDLESKYAFKLLQVPTINAGGM
jgi:hypothetical protein